MKCTRTLCALFAFTFLASAQALAVGFNCRNEDPHIIAELQTQSENPGMISGKVIVSFVHGALACPLTAQRTRSFACNGQYRTSPVERFSADFVLRTNQIAILNLQLPRISGGGSIAVTCFQK